MEKAYHIETIIEYNNFAQHQTLHPLASVIDFSKFKSSTKPGHKVPRVLTLSFGFYAIFLKEDKNCIIKYGRNYYDYQEGTLVFIAPHQIMSIEQDDDKGYKPSGKALIFHPDLIRGTSLSRHIEGYSFFSYELHEALHISAQENQIVLDCFSKVNQELERSIDKYSKKLIASNIELFLNYCLRFYDRQFITREIANKNICEKFEKLLSDYFQTERPQTIGLPSVTFCAGQFSLSANYFGDLIKRETGKTAQEHIHHKMIEVAKEKIIEPKRSISEIAGELGFKYPQHFTRFFKQKVGYTPNEYRNLN